MNETIILLITTGNELSALYSDRSLFKFNNGCAREEGSFFLWSLSLCTRHQSLSLRFCHLKRLRRIRLSNYSINSFNKMREKLQHYCSCNPKHRVREKRKRGHFALADVQFTLINFVKSQLHKVMQILIISLSGLLTRLET